MNWTVQPRGALTARDHAGARREDALLYESWRR